MTEILAALQPVPTPPTVSPPALDFSTPVGIVIDPFLPRFESPSGISLPPAEAAAPAGNSWILGSTAGFLSRWRIEGGNVEDATNGSGLGELPGGILCLSADFDRDGDADLFVGRGGDLPDSLLRQTADGPFEDVTESFGLLEFLDLADAAWVDFDRDGWLDLCVVQKPVKGWEGPLLRLYQNQSGTAFTDVAESSGLSVSGEVHSLLWRDFDDDGYPEPLLSISGKPGALKWWKNSSGEDGGGRRFTDATAESGLQGIAGGGPMGAGDLDNDGRDDLVVAGEGTLTILTASGGSGALFSNRSADVPLSGIASPSIVLVEDLDRDGLPDLAVTGGAETSPETKAWWNSGGLLFREIPGAAGLRADAPIRQLAAIDPAASGSPGWMVVAGPSRPSALLSSASALAAERSRVVLWCRAPETANRDAFGARVKISARDRAYVTTPYFRTVTGNPAIIGLDEATSIESIEITWPDRDRTVTRLENLPIDHLFEIGTEPTPISRIPLPPTAPLSPEP